MLDLWLYTTFLKKKKKNWILCYDTYLQGICMKNLDFELKFSSPFYDAILDIWVWIPFKWNKFI